MVRKVNKKEMRLHRHVRVRGNISGTPERPRLNVFRSNANIYAQIIDDVNGVTLVSANTLEKGFSKELEINGVGYRADKKGNQLVMRLGYSHEVIMDEIPGISVAVDGNKITVSGIDKQVVGQFAAEVRGKRPPEPYKGKGIKYTTEVIRRKVGKTGGKK